MCVLPACLRILCMHVCVLRVVTDFVLRLIAGPERCDEKSRGGDVCGRSQTQTERRVSIHFNLNVYMNLNEFLELILFVPSQGF